ncbi:DUF3127 domain-containing protein [Chryseobacterium bernardetii]|uniref:DUF3127 domain-containing protein n=1 Tax=Chryseobacterium bernardetii TaxID=1241978 RepID=UPI0016278279|nr:DUF3127 domain-containing protein [Chryseobacterium bernardetii]
MQLVGIIKSIEPIQTFKSNFEKRDFIFITEEIFPQTLKIELHSLHIDIIDPFKPGDRVSVRIKIFGKEGVSKDGSVRYYNTIVASKISMH